MPPKKAPPKVSKPVATKPAAKPGAGKATVKKAPAAVTKPGQGTNKKPAAQSASKPKAAETPKVKKWTKEDEAARKIQTEIRRYLARKELSKRKKKKSDYEKLMDDLEKEAFAKLVKMEQEKAEKEREKEEEERRRKKEAAKRKKRMLEAAFDGDTDEIITILKEVKDLDNQSGVGTDVIGTVTRNKHMLEMIDCEDANKNTPVSEAASGGCAEVVQMLIDKGANPNSQGQFMRTPLYRAAFAGHLDACQVLLQNGADPRVYAEDGQTPEQIASLDNIKDLLSEWDIEQTERLLKKLDLDREKRKEEENRKREAVMSQLEGKVEEAEKEYRSWQKQVMKVTEELNKRIEEHDTAAASGFDRPQLTLQAIHDCEAELEIAKMDWEKSRDRMSALKLQYREHQKGAAEASGNTLPGLQVTIRELEDVLLRDVGNRIKDSGKWPLVIDTSGQAATFLRYRDTNYINALSPKNMEVEKLRLAILGSLRYGKPLVLDMMEVDMFETCTMVMDRIQPGLMNAIMDKSVKDEQFYIKLIREADGPDYSKNNFSEFRLKHFVFVIITKNSFPADNLMDTTYPIRIHIPT